VAARGEVEHATFRTEGVDHHHSTNHALVDVVAVLRVGLVVTGLLV